MVTLFGSETTQIRPIENGSDDEVVGIGLVSAGVLDRAQSVALSKSTRSQKPPNEDKHGRVRSPNGWVVVTLP